MMLAGVLLGVVVSAPCAGALGTIGPVSVPCERMVGLETGGDLCGTAIRLLRTEAVDIAMREASAYPTPGEIESRLDRYYPSKEKAEAQWNAQRERQRRLAAAVRESRADPTHDREVWRRNLDGRMTYEQWVSFRTKVGDERVSDPQGDAVFTDESFQQLRTQMRPTVIEQLFQEWVRGPWSLQERKVQEKSWTFELQDAFWTKFLASHPMALHSSLTCNGILPVSLRGPGMRTPVTNEQNGKKGKP